MNTIQGWYVELESGAFHCSSSCRSPRQDFGAVSDFFPTRASRPSSDQPVFFAQRPRNILQARHILTCASLSSRLEPVDSEVRSWPPKQINSRPHHPPIPPPIPGVARSESSRSTLPLHHCPFLPLALRMPALRLSGVWRCSCVI